VSVLIRELSENLHYSAVHNSGVVPLNFTEAFRTVKPYCPYRLMRLYFLLNPPRTQLPVYSSGGQQTVTYHIS